MAPPRPKPKLKAKCEANQAALDRLADLRAAAASNDRYNGFALKRAMDSLAAAAAPVETHAQAVLLKFVGPAMASIICPPTRERLEQSKNRAAASAALSSASSPADSVTSSAAGSQRPVHAAAAKQGKRPRKAPTATAALLYATVHDQQQQPVAAVGRKEAAYQQAVAASQAWHHEQQQQRRRDGSRSTEPTPLAWKVVLLIDNREKRSEHIIAKCQMSGIPCEERCLPIGDMAWLAQGRAAHSRSNHNLNNPQRKGEKVVVVELMLGTIIERKTPEDLQASLFGTRYREQRLRLQHSGLPQVLFLMEGDLTKDVSHRCPADTLHTAVWETRLHLDFAIVHTAHLEGTVMTLKRMHRRILQRTFPQAFAVEALPTFQEADAASNQQQRLQQRRVSLEEQGRRRRRRRRQSLAEMTFDMNPEPPLGMPRFISYAELKAKIECDREAGTKTVGSLHLAMLKQVASFSTRKCLAVARAYPTAHALLQAYAMTGAAAGNSTLVAELPTHETDKSFRSQTIGPRSANELYIAYGTSDDQGMTGTAALTETSAAISAALQMICTNVSVFHASRPPAATAVLDRKRAANPPSVDWRESSDDDRDPRNSGAPAPISRPKKRLNTSIGSLLHSSDDDDAAAAPTMPRTAVATRDHAMLAERGQKTPPTLQHGGSSSDDDEEGVVVTGHSLVSERRHAPRRHVEGVTTKSVRLANEVIEID